MMAKKWKVSDYDPNGIHAMATALALSPLTVAVLFGRGIDDVEKARVWLSRHQGVGHDPFHMPDMECAIDRLHQAIQQGERICCFGDYDVDGMSATSLYLLYLQEQGAKVGFYIPDRQTEGYGLNESAIQQLAQDGVKVLMTIDCGTTSHREVTLANRLGMDVIITDHHQIQGEHPPALAFLNPQRADSLYPFKGLCSGGIAYKVVNAHASAYGQRGPDIDSYSDFVALATLADMVPLQDENRLFVRQGLHRMSNGSRCGVRAIQQQLGISTECTESLVAFQLAPILNAAGRLAHGRLGVELLTSNTEHDANHLAEHLVSLNRRRREIERTIFQEAVGIVERMKIPSGLVVGKDQWHVGVVGIVAARLVERYQKPAVVVAFDQSGFGRGSVRSLPGLDACRLLQQCADLLDGFGGHPAAAGLKIWKGRFPDFQERFSSLVADMHGNGASASVIDVDAQVSLRQVTHPLLCELGRLHPFGVGNPEPTFMAVGLKVLEQRVIGDEHLKLILRQNQSAPFESIGFRMASWKESKRLQDQYIDLVFVPELNRWKGLDRIQLRIRDFKVSETIECL